LRTQLDEGESAVIALAAELENSVVVLDDKKTRRVARQMGLSVVGTVASCCERSASIWCPR
jgi:predicted nucleic acid-binding protein